MAKKARPGCSHNPADRYHRQEMLGEIGSAGQRVLQSSRVVVIGVGATGSVAAGALARAGVGEIVVVDRDFVELGNLHRQVLYDERDIGRTKAVSAAEHLEAINSEIKIEPVVADASPANIQHILRGADIVIDGTDNMDSRYLINDACVKARIPWVYAGAISTYGMTMPILPRRTACLRCLFPTPARPGVLPTCDTTGILGMIPEIMGSMAAASALRILVGKMPPRDAALLTYDCWSGEFERLVVARNPECPCCGGRVFEYLSAKRDFTAISLCGKDCVQVTPPVDAKIDLQKLARRAKGYESVTYSPVMVTLALKGGLRANVFPDGRAIISGTADKKVALRAYYRIVDL